MKLLYFLPAWLILLGCSPQKKEIRSLKHYDLNQSQQFFLASELREISGLTLADGNIYTHNDEKGMVYELDKSGKISRNFYPGARPIKKDFEGIASDGTNFYLITSDGIIYQFRKTDSSSVNFSEFKTPLNTRYDVEGLCNDPETGTLLIACKDYPRKMERNVRGVFAFNTKDGTLINKPRFVISLDELKENFGINGFSPSGIERHEDGTFYVISSRPKAIAVISKEGKIIEAAELPSKHMQPEGITFLPNGDMIICDEGGNDDGELTLYKYKSGNK